MLSGLECNMAFTRLVLPGTVSIGALLSFTLSILQAKSENVSPQKGARVAIIGSGIGGASAAHFLRQMLGPSAHIAIFERTQVIGGRLATVTIDGDSYETGGSVIHPENVYMKKFARELNLDTREVTAAQFSIYDGSNLAFDSGTWVKSLKLLWRYGFGLLKIKSMTDGFLNSFKNIYTLQDKGETFHSVYDLLCALGGEEYYKVTQVTLEKYLKDKGLSQVLIDELVTGVMRNNYGQSAQLNAFVGSVSLAGAHPGLWAVKGGNKKVCEGLIEQSNITLNRNVHIIEIIKKEQPDNQTPVYFLRSPQALLNTMYDVVIIAMPLAVQQNFIGCDGCKQWPGQEQLGSFHKTVATFLKGNINKTHFNSALLENIFTMEKEDILFNSIGIETSVLGKKSDQEKRPVWKVFSRESLKQELIDKVFLEAEVVKEIHWLAYPHYDPPEKFLPFVLDDGIFYVNAIESAASAMEMSALSGRNAALLAAKYLGEEKLVKSDETIGHAEL